MATPDSTSSDGRREQLLAKLRGAQQRTKQVDEESGRAVYAAWSAAGKRRRPSVEHLDFSTPTPKKGRDDRTARRSLRDDDDDDEEDRMSFASGARGGAESAVSGDACEVPCGKRCLGCDRTTGTDMSFYIPGQPFMWLYSDGRGDWCKDCVGLHRVIYKSCRTMTVFSKWLRSNRAEFLSRLVAYISLKKEGVAHVVSQTIERRCAMLEHAFELCGYPWPVGVVQVIRSTDGAAALQNAFIIPGAGAAATAEDNIFALVPRPFPVERDEKDSFRLVTKAQADVVWPLEPTCAASERMQEWWKTHSDFVCDTSAAQACTKTGAASSESGSPKGVSATSKMGADSKYRVAFDALRSSTLVMIRQFATEDETNSVKERDYTPMLSKAFKLRQDVMQTPFAQTELMTEIDALIDLLTATKKTVIGKSERRDVW